MINLRYHIVSLTAVFLAIGIGLTLGSTFLDRATVENLNGQLENLETRLGDREEQINELEGELDEADAVQTALDEQGAGLLADRMAGTPVVVIAAQGVDEADVDGAVQTLQVAGADVQGLWWLTERLLLANEAEVDDLATLLDEPSADPARLRRVAVDALGAEIRAAQLTQPTVDQPTDGEAGDGTTDEGAADGDAAAPAAGDESTPATTAAPAAGDESNPATTAAPDGSGDDALDEAAGDDPSDEVSGDTTLTQALVEAGFISFEPVTDGAELAVLPAGVRVVLVGGSSVLPDDVFVEPLVERLARGTSTPTLTAVTSAMPDSSEVAEVVSVVRADDTLRSLVSTVDSLDHFPGWMAVALAVEDLGDRVIGHYGLGEGASALLPPLQTP